MTLLRQFVTALLATLCSSTAAAHTFQCSGTGDNTILSLSGGIDEGFAKAFVAAFSQCFPSGYRGLRQVELNSPGGLVSEALSIASWLVNQARSRPVMTRIPSRASCISACTYLFVAGTFREAQVGASIEPHGFSGYLGRSLDILVTRTDSEIQDDVSVSRLVKATEIIKIMSQTYPALRWAESMEPGRDPVGTIRSVARRPSDFSLLNAVDGALRSALPEAERDAALKAYFALSNGQVLARTDIEREAARYISWSTRLVEVSFKIYGKVPTLPADVRESIARTVAREYAVSAALFADDLWPYLKTRAQAIDLDGLIRLMFSTSILYTRPLTRDELCDLNIVNGNCQ